MILSNRLKLSLSLIFSFGLMTLTGCSGLNSDFTCPMQPGVVCSSLDQVNTMVDQGKIGAVLPSSSQNTQAITQNPLPIQSLALSSSSLLRNPEAVMRIWIAPYEDQDGNYHLPGTLYSVVKPGHWINNPARAVDDN